jgi:hypothetical protein
VALAAKPISRPSVITLDRNTSDSAPAILADAGGDLPMSQSATVVGDANVADTSVLNPDHNAMGARPHGD